MKSKVEKRKKKKEKIMLKTALLVVILVLLLYIIYILKEAKSAETLTPVGYLKMDSDRSYSPYYYEKDGGKYVKHRYGPVFDEPTWGIISDVLSPKYREADVNDFARLDSSVNVPVDAVSPPAWSKEFAYPMYV